jgi:hypothetical protein
MLFECGELFFLSARREGAGGGVVISIAAGASFGN